MGTEVNTTMFAVAKPRPTSTPEAWPKGLISVYRPIPSLSSTDQVKLKVLYAAICGTDVSIYHSSKALYHEMIKSHQENIVVGHEFVGTLEDAGDSAKLELATILRRKAAGYKHIQQFVKDRTPLEIAKDPDIIPFIKENFYITAEMHITCGHCKMCRIGQAHNCINTVIKGIHEDGIFTSYVVLPSRNITLVPKGEIPPEIISIMDPIGNAVHTLQTVNLFGQNIAVLGAGVIGQILIAIAARSGISKMFVTDFIPPNRSPKAINKLELAAKLGANYVFNMYEENAHSKLLNKVLQETDGIGVDIVFEMSGSSEAYIDAFNIVRPGGTVVLLGIPSKEILLDFSEKVIFKGVTIKGVIGRRLFSTWEIMYSLLQTWLSGLLLENHIITHKFPLKDYDEAFKTIERGEALKIILIP